MNFLSLVATVVVGVTLYEQVTRPLSNLVVERLVEWRNRRHVDANLARVNLQHMELLENLKAKREAALQQPDVDAEQLEHEYERAVQMVDIGRKMMTAKVLCDAGMHDEHRRMAVDL